MVGEEVDKITGRIGRSRQGRSFSRAFLGRVEIQASHFFVLYSFEGESNSFEHLKIVLEIIQMAEGCDASGPSR